MRVEGGDRVNKATFLKEQQEWRDRWNRFFDENPEKMPPRGYEKSWECITTCRTSGCPMENHSYLAKITEQLDGVYRVQCGRCGNAIEDLDPMLDDDEEFRLNCRMPDGSSWMILEEADV